MRVEEFVALMTVRANSVKSIVGTWTSEYEEMADSCFGPTREIIQTLTSHGLIKKALTKKAHHITDLGDSKLSEACGYVRYLVSKPRGAENYSGDYTENECWTCDNHLEAYHRINHKNDFLLTINKRETDLNLDILRSKLLRMRTFRGEQTFDSVIETEFSIQKWYRYTSNLEQPDDSEVILKDDSGHCVTFEDFLTLKEYSAFTISSPLKKAYVKSVAYWKQFETIEFYGTNWDSSRKKVNGKPFFHKSENENVSLYLRGYLSCFIDVNLTLSYEITEYGIEILKRCQEAVDTGSTPLNGR